MFGREQSGINRQQAILEGKKSYTSITPCKVCGSYEKFVSSYSCKECSLRRGYEKLKNKELMEQYRTRAKVNAKTYRYRTRKKDQCPDDADHEKIESFYREAERLTEETGIMHHVDHIVPISKGGQHHHDNLQVLTATENLKKGNKLL
jgi:5-methylcytosine-specific restriction endonuclease McrA